MHRPGLWLLGVSAQGMVGFISAFARPVESSPAAQKSLSQRRAEAVRNYLASHGIAPDRMLAKGYGRDRLVADCADVSCKAQNRRVITNPQESADSGATATQ